MAGAKRLKVFLDTSALFAGIWSETGGGRAILKLGEAEVIQIICSSQVLSELEGAFREKAPQALSRLALLISAANVETAEAPPESLRREVLRWIPYRPDAEVAAAAIFARSDYFVTLDKQHFLSNKKLRVSVKYQIGTPGDFLAWLRAKLASEE